MNHLAMKCFIPCCGSPMFECVEFIDWLNLKGTPPFRKFLFFACFKQTFAFFFLLSNVVGLHLTTKHIFFSSSFQNMINKLKRICNIFFCCCVVQKMHASWTQWINHARPAPSEAQSQLGFCSCPHFFHQPWCEEQTSVKFPSNNNDDEQHALT